MPPKAVFDAARAAELHSGGTPLGQIANLPGMPSAHAIKRQLLENGYEVWKGPWKLRAMTKEKFRELYHVQHLSAEEIGAMFKCGASTVRRKAAKFGLAKGRGKEKSRVPKGDKHWSWRGGKHEDGNGYIRLRMPDHPNANKNGYVLEHRFVASEAIGRPLATSEEVHHIDGNKKNNSPDNLIVVPKGEHQRLHARVCQELQALRAEVARLSHGKRGDGWRVVG